MQDDILKNTHPFGSPGIVALHRKQRRPGKFSDVGVEVFYLHRSLDTVGAITVLLDGKAVDVGSPACYFDDNPQHQWTMPLSAKQVREDRQIVLDDPRRPLQPLTTPRKLTAHELLLARKLNQQLIQGYKANFSEGLDDTLARHLRETQTQRDTLSIHAPLRRQIDEAKTADAAPLSKLRSHAPRLGHFQSPEQLVRDIDDEYENVPKAVKTARRLVGRKGCAIYNGQHFYFVVSE